jgi:hypothetical protein
LVLFGIGSSVIVWQYGSPQFVLLWLLCFYVTIGLVETVRALPERLRRRSAEPAVIPDQDALCSPIGTPKRESNPAPQG